MANKKSLKRVQTQEEFEKGRQRCADAMKKFEAGDIDGAIKLFQEARELGDVEATFTLGILHTQGIGVEADQLKADECFEYVAHQEGNNPKIGMSQYYLGLHSELGVEMGGKVVVPQDYKKAFYWYEKAAHRNVSEAMLAYGLANIRGEGTKENPEEGLRYVFMSAGLENADANSYIASYYNELMMNVEDVEDKKLYMLKATYYMRRAERLGDEECRKLFEKVKAQGQNLPTEEETAKYGLADMTTVLDEIKANYDRIDKEQEVLNKRYGVESTWKGEAEKKTKSKTTSEKAVPKTNKAKAEPKSKAEPKATKPAKAEQKDNVEAEDDELNDILAMLDEDTAKEQAGGDTANTEDDELNELLVGLDDTENTGTSDEEILDLIDKLDEQITGDDPEADADAETAKSILSQKMVVDDEGKVSIQKRERKSKNAEPKEVQSAEKKPKAKEAKTQEDEIKKELRLGKEAYNADKYEEAYQHWFNAMELGSAAGMMHVASCYSAGEGVAKDMKKTHDYYVKVAERDEVDMHSLVASFNLGVMYVNGEGCKKDDKKAMQWLKWSADHGYKIAQHTFGNFLENGKNGLKVNLKMAEVYYLRSAVQEHVDAMSQLVMLYANYEEYAEKEDSVLKMLYWLANAGSKGNKQCEKILEDYWKEMGDKFPSSDECIEATKLDIANALLANKETKVENIEGFENLELKTASKKATKSKTKENANEQPEEKPRKTKSRRSIVINEETAVAVDENGNKYNAEETKCLMLIKNGLEHMQKGEADKAISLWEEAYHLGNPDAAFNLAICYENGQGVTQDLKKSFELYMFAASHKEPNRYDAVKDAQFNVGNGYYHGNGVKQDMKKAYEWYRKAADNGQATAQYNMGFSLLTGNNVDADIPNAFKYLEMSADNGFVLAQSLLGKLYYEGIGLKEPEKENGIKYYKLAAEQGDESAKEALEKIEKYEKERDEALKEVKSKFKDVKEVKSPEDLKDIKVVTMDNITETLDSIEGKNKSPKKIEKDRKAFIKKMLTIQVGKDRAYQLTHVQDYEHLYLDELELLANLGDPRAQCVLGDRYFTGAGRIKKDLDKAISLYSKAYANGDAVATYKLAKCYGEGTGVSQDPVRSFALMVDAADKGNIEACQVMLGYYIKSDEKENRPPYAEKIAESGDRDCCAYMAVAYLFGKDGLKRNSQKALYFARKGLNQTGLSEQNLYDLTRVVLMASKNKKEKAKIIDTLVKLGKDSVKCLTTAALFLITGEFGIEIDFKKSYDILKKAEKIAKDDKEKKSVETLQKAIAITECCPYCKRFFTKIYKLGVWDKVPYCSKCGKKWPKIPKELLKARDKLKTLEKKAKDAGVTN